MAAPLYRVAAIGCVAVEPAEIEFIERTLHGRLRHASFRRLPPRSGGPWLPVRCWTDLLNTPLFSAASCVPRKAKPRQFVTGFL